MVWCVSSNLVIHFVVFVSPSSWAWCGECRTVLSFILWCLLDHLVVHGVMCVRQSCHSFCGVCQYVLPLICWCLSDHLVIHFLVLDLIIFYFVVFVRPSCN